MTDQIRVLLIDDDQEDFFLISDMLAEAENTRFKLAWVKTYEAGLEAICKEEHDVYLLDYFIGAHNGLGILKKAVEGGCKAPVIFLTAHGNYEIDLEAMEAGASDYLAKGEFTVPILERSIRYSIESKRIEEELKEHRSNLEELVRERTIQHAEARADAERRAREAEGRQAILEALLEHIPVGIVLVNSPSLQVQALSRYAVDMVGLAGREQKRSQPLTDLDLSVADLWPDSSGLLKPIKDAALRGKIASDQEHAVKVRCEENIPVLVSAGPIRDSLGNVTGAVAAWRDISELKRIQEELRIARDNLELRVQQRTQELAETLMELRESREELKLLASQLLRAQEDERKRIAREIHDSIGSSLSAVKFCVENAAARLTENPEVRESFMTLSRAMEQAIDEARRIMTDLRPSLLDDFGIIATIGWFCRGFECIYTDIPVEKDIRLEESQVPENLKIIIFRIIQEAMNNSAKHSRARKVSLGLSFEDGCIALRVSDDGVGFDRAAAASKGQGAKFGLTSMRERAELSGGEFEIESIRKIGTTISVRWKK
ncbi:MAG TPA: response regulator [Deltaproteobacteria bacterium]|jgi:PAS domain S-box-containing protein|nr:response regulator [Deltaproteobacteria bacterium]